MTEFFRGWRRKVGCVTLVMACVLCGGWVRGSTVMDQIVLGTPTGLHEWRADTVHVFHSFEDGLGWIRMWEPSDAPRVIRENGNLSMFLLMDGKGNIEWQTETREVNDSGSLKQVQWRWNVGGCRYGGQPPDQKSGIGAAVLQVPYTFMMVPLTLLSACLMLWQPRKRAEQGHA